MRRTDVHERLTEDHPITGSSDRSFGVVVTVALTVVGVFPLLNGEPPRWWSLAVAGVMLVVTLVRAELLAPFNRVWFRFGLFLHRVVNPVIMAVIYFGVVTPTGLIMRAVGKDPLRLRRDPNAESYWIHRTPPGPEPESMTNQF